MFKDNIQHYDLYDPSTWYDELCSEKLMEVVCEMVDNSYSTKSTTSTTTTTTTTSTTTLETPSASQQGGLLDGIGEILLNNPILKEGGKVFQGFMSLLGR